jgi:hypothetical protein
MALGWQAQNGADFPRYAQWPKAFASSNILHIQSTVLSPVGVPMTHWSHAPGLITDAFDRALSFLPSVKIDLHTVSWLVAVVFWWAMIGLVRLATRGDPVLFVLALGAAFIGTHLGFYSIFHSSEIFSLASFTVALFWALSAGAGRLRDSLIIGIACGLLLIVRVNLAMYVLLPIAARAIIVWRAYGNRLHKALVFHALVLGAPLLVYGVELLLFNYWATGSASRSPYVYGDAGFRTLDFAHPLVGTMLFHSWHGLLTYHPLFALGPIALVALSLRRDLPLAERFGAGYALFALLAQWYIQASFWCWWNGTATFGNRTLAVGGVVVVVALVRWLLLLTRSATRKSMALAVILSSLTAASCCWSFLLYLQGQSNYLTWRALLQEQRHLLREASVFVPLLVATLLSLGFGLVAFRALRMRAVVAGIAAFIATLATQALWADVVRAWLTGWGFAPYTSATQGFLSAMAFAVIVYLITNRQAVPNPLRPARAAVGLGLLCVFLLGSWSFYRLTMATKSVIAHATAKPHNYRFRAAMAIDDLLECVPEYEQVEGFTERKLALKHFVEVAAMEARQKLFKPTRGR